MTLIQVLLSVMIQMMCVVHVKRGRVNEQPSGFNVANAQYGITYHVPMFLQSNMTRWMNQLNGFANNAGEIAI